MEQKIIGKIYNGFKLLEKRNLNDISSEGFLFKHIKSGARLLYISNKDDNKVFSISFRTPPKDNTGLTHILEHCVLCGSRKYKAKEPFVELLKGSLNTYLNAMTFSDKTMYPVASRNDKDFKNLVDVYMDAVFYPMIYERPEIFLQESWHYSFDNSNKTLSYKGVVYNEMKGAYSSSDRVLDIAITKCLFPDNQYRFESGGNPENIPDLSYDEFLDFHKKYYHPSNSYIYLYGNSNIDEYLSYLDNEYLKNFDEISIDSSINHQSPFNKSKQINATYSISQQEDEKDKTYLALSFVTGESTSAQHMLSMDILRYILLETPASPIKSALLNAGIGKSIYGNFETNINQPVFSIISENANVNQKEEFQKIVIDELKKIIDNGIDKKLIEGAINIWEFLMREAEYGYRPKGLVYCIQAMRSWLYDGDPMIFMDYEKYFTELKSALTTNYFEKIIKKYLLDNNHSCLAIVSPEKGLENKISDKLKEKLENIKNSMSDDELKKIINLENKLKKYHQTPDTKDILEQIPILELKDIEKKASDFPIEVIEKDDYKLLFHNMDTNKIIYIKLMFDSRTVPQEMIPYLSLLADIIGKISTKNYTYGQLSNEVSIYTGGIGFSPEVYTARDNNYYPKFIISGKSLIDKFPKLLDLLEEIINNTLYNENKRIKDIIKENKTNIISDLISSGNVTAARRASSNIFESSSYNEQISNISYYEFLCSIEKDIDSNIEDIKQKLKFVSENLFNRKNLIVSVTLNEKYKKEFEKNFYLFENKIRNKDINTNIYKFNKKPNREGFPISSKIQYVAKAVDYLSIGYKFNGSLMVVQTILDLDYLWNTVRVHGGAYGASISIAKNGYILMSSYRDPNIIKTLEAYNNIGQYLSDINIDDRELRKYIIGTINSIDISMSCEEKGKSAAIRYITGLTYKQIQKDRDEILSTNLEDIKNYSNMFKEAMKQNNIVVIGNENAINEDTNLFDDINTILQN